MTLYLFDYTTNTDIDNFNDFFNLIETGELLPDILAKTTMAHENDFGQLDLDDDIKIEIIHPQEDTFKATASDPVCFDISCDLLVEYSIVSAQ